MRDVNGAGSLAAYLLPLQVLRFGTGKTHQLFLGGLFSPLRKPVMLGRKRISTACAAQFRPLTSYRSSRPWLPRPFGSRRPNASSALREKPFAAPLHMLATRVAAKPMAFAGSRTAAVGGALYKRDKSHLSLALDNKRHQGGEETRDWAHSCVGRLCNDTVQIPHQGDDLTVVSVGWGIRRLINHMQWAMRTHHMRSNQIFETVAGALHQLHATLLLTGCAGTRCRSFSHPGRWRWSPQYPRTRPTQTTLGQLTGVLVRSRTEPGLCLTRSRPRSKQLGRLHMAVMLMPCSAWVEERTRLKKRLRLSVAEY